MSFPYKITDRFQCIFFQPADLGLRDADFISNLGLGFSFIKPFLNNVIFSVIKLMHRFLQGKMLNPGLLPVFLISDLIH